ncbi:BTB/POZ domain-containing protein KCTD6 isoform X1 [Myotis daubentonii]|uniref:BTB/POZ domain-containing protein KCTD6 isoform X1 n=1 Tax=Myotis daubentonii TaxID=98922 RepID=UPI0028739D0D|nr:BTB/POZ domain-containing protein KCTD6 isoform X1 [Myotis daubentonii]
MRRLTQKTPLDVAGLVTMKSISLSNSHVSTTEQFSTKTGQQPSVTPGQACQTRARRPHVAHREYFWGPANITFSWNLGSPDAALEQMDNGDWGYMMTDPVTLNVGGHLYTTSLTTLTRYPDSMLGAMFGGDFPTARDPQGNYFIDRDGPLFRYVLNFLRTSELTLPLDFKEFDLLRKEADFYQIEPLIQCLNDPKPLYPMDTFEEVVELSSTRKLSKYSNPVAVIITQLTITTKVHSLLEGISNYFTKWNKHMMDTRDCQVSFTFGPCDYHQEVSLRVHLMEYITKQGFTIRNTRVHHMSERANENTVEHNWTFCRLARKTDD